jgi:hypothetical protein
MIRNRTGESGSVKQAVTLELCGELRPLWASSNRHFIELISPSASASTASPLPGNIRPTNPIVSTPSAGSWCGRTAKASAFTPKGIRLIGFRKPRERNSARASSLHAYAAATLFRARRCNQLKGGG